MELLTEKYRPKKIEDLVLVSKEFGDKLKSWKAKGTIDSHLLLHGKPGTGKSSTVSVILNELNITDYLMINGSDKTGVDDTRRIIEYASVPPFNDGVKLVIIEEFERLSPQAQDSLKYVLEKFSGWCRFIFTTNNINKVTAPIISRCEAFAFNNLDVESYINKIMGILKQENITNNVEDLTDYINASYPDLRKCINLINQNVVDGKLNKLSNDNIVDMRNKYQIVFDFIKGKGDILATQKYLATTLNGDDYDNVYKTLYNNLEYISNDKRQWEQILVIVADYLYKNNTVAFKDLNLMACLISLKSIMV